jgi:phosphopantothenoylcysteine decarboxylase/phosphopantothenate--cysteine ligase
VELLKSYGNHLIDVGTGELASGLSGAGRLAEPEEIVKILADFLAGTQVQGKGSKKQGKKAPKAVEPLASAKPAPPAKQDLKGKNILITAGPTYEDLDPVRYLGNRSTGRMGIALAEAAAARGAAVNLVLGPTELTTTASGVTVHNVRSAREMHAVSVINWPKADAAILAAAVADYRPSRTEAGKIKKKEGPLTVKLVRNPDIAAELGQDKRPNQRLVGFALETENGLENARGKLKRKNLDFIVLNSPNDKGAAFGHTTNKIQLVSGNKVTPFKLKSKADVAEDILDALVKVL